MEYNHLSITPTIAVHHYRSIEIAVGYGDYGLFKDLDYIIISHSYSINMECR